MWQELTSTKEVKDSCLLHRLTIAAMPDNERTSSEGQPTQSTSGKATPTTHEMQRTSFKLPKHLTIWFELVSSQVNSSNLHPFS